MSGKMTEGRKDNIKEVRVRVNGGCFEPAKSDDEKGWLLWSASVPVENLKDGEH
jgi:hypothetical protein